MALVGVEQIGLPGAGYSSGSGESRGGVVSHITLRRVEKKNALTPEMLDELITAIIGAEGAGGLGARAVLLSGLAGDGGFCAGFDLKQCQADDTVLPRLLNGLSRAIVALRRLPAPVVIAAHGTAIAGGCALLGGADVIVAASDLRLGYPVVRLGISPAVSAPFVAQSMGHGAARERLLDPSLLTGPQARKKGLVHEIVSDDPGGQATIRRGLEIAMQLAAKPGAGARTTKDWMNELDGSLDEARVRSGLEVSLGLVGSAEQQAMLAALWK
jgi:methylglutaconyl-CoA hydratase